MRRESNPQLCFGHTTATMYIHSCVPNYPGDTSGRSGSPPFSSGTVGMPRSSRCIQMQGRVAVVLLGSRSCIAPLAGSVRRVEALAPSHP